MKQDVLIIIFLLTVSSFASPQSPPSSRLKRKSIISLKLYIFLTEISLGSGTYSQYLKSTTEETINLTFLIKPARKAINTLIDDFDPASEPFRLVQSTSKYFEFP